MSLIPPTRHSLPLVAGAHAYVIDGWMPESEATATMQLLQRVPWSQQKIAVFGHMSREMPRLTAYFGDHGTSYSYSGTVNPSKSWAEAQWHFLRDLRDRVATETGHHANQALLNYYRSGADSIGWHSDDERELGEDPFVVSVSFGGPRVLKLRRVSGGPVLDVELGHGALFVMSGATNRLYRHSIAKVAHAEPRISVTFRKVFT